ncbi:hypothetical protein [Sphingomonas psychrotolerans]|uniref:Uncharacterized protein n=1 Tax=Sphingomonas psychrotolerans TaxID=1327635 RepID=A0A2K8MI85_9SPHN|nr:hypothetical protein [Sphingomonas psychrotolerans]ATY31469.1 hypothetical protein CVN68_05290 [Sphingomonas psychrotolerans]
MLKTLLFCVVTVGLSVPVWAGERSGARSRTIARAGLIKDPAALRAPASASSAVPQRFMLPAGGARLERLPEPLTEKGQAPSAEAGRWGPGSTLPEVTARAGGSYAVHDILRDQPRPRHRGSALSTAFVLKLDGDADSPAFSVGGGGVAAAMWRAVPK